MRVFEAFADPLSVGPVGDPFARGRQVVLVMGVLDVGEELSAVTHEVKPPAHQVPGRSHLGRVDIGPGVAGHLAGAPPSRGSRCGRSWLLPHG